MSATLTAPESSTIESSSLNIADYLRVEHQRCVERVNEWSRAKRQLKGRIKECAEKILKLQIARAPKATLVHAVKEQGGETTILDRQIENIDKEISEISSEQEGLENQFISLKEPVELHASHHVNFAQQLAATYGCETAKRIASMNECYAELHTQLCLNDAGRPQKIVIDLGANESVEIPIKSDGKRFAKVFRPEALKWLPSSELKPDTPNANPNHGDCEFLAYFDEATQRLLVSSTKTIWYERENSYRGEEHVERSADISNLADSLPKHVQECVSAADGVIDLQLSYENNPLAAELVSRVLALTTTEAQFKPQSKTPTSQAIQATIKSDWEAFIKCPWSADVKNTLALLKYYAENGERPRFWSGPFEGHYGFRLRTRDHSWIKGQVYMEPTGAVADADTPLVVRPGPHYNGVVASLGRFHVFVESNKRDT